MELKLEKLTLPIGAVAGVVTVCFTVFLFLDTRHTHPEDIAASESTLNNRLLMAESTRYAEIEKYYVDRLKQGEKLSQAELDRLDLVQRQQHRIAEIIRGGE